MPVQRITKRVVDAAKPQPATYLVRDTELKGFVLVVTSYGGKSYAVDYRAGRGRGGRKRRMTIGKHGSPWTPETARREALRLLADVSKGNDPLEQRGVELNRKTLAEICDLYFSEGVFHKKATTLRADLSRTQIHLKPLLGRRLIESITRADVERFMLDVKTGKMASAKSPKRKAGSITKGGQGAAAQCVALLSTLFNFAVARKMVKENPAKGVKKPPVRKMNRFLSEKEFARLSSAISAEEATTGNPYPAAAIRLLLLTGCRKSEILTLEWGAVDFADRCLRLPDSKTGAKIVYLNAPALVVLQTLPREVDNPLVIGGTRAGRGVLGIDRVWSRVRSSAGLVDVRLHDLRHSFASVGARGGLSLPILGALLGHTNAVTTARYAHLSDDPVRAANEMVGERIATSLGFSMTADNLTANDDLAGFGVLDRRHAVE
jgi:integrase